MIPHAFTLPPAKSSIEGIESQLPSLAMIVLRRFSGSIFLKSHHRQRQEEAMRRTFSGALAGTTDRSGANVTSVGADAMEETVTP